LSFVEHFHIHEDEAQIVERMEKMAIPPAAIARAIAFAIEGEDQLLAAGRLDSPGECFVGCVLPSAPSPL
jgi:hypothetical protein